MRVAATSPIEERFFANQVAAVYAAQALNSVAANMLIMSIFFFTTHNFGWGLKENFLLSASQGLAYALGALSAGRMSAWWGRRGMLIGVNLALIAITGAAVVHSSPLVVIIVAIAYTFGSSSMWPALESLVSSGVSPAMLSRRIGVYNLVWAGISIIAVGVSGLLIETDRRLLFAVPVAAHFSAVVILWIARGVEVDSSSAVAHPQAEPALLAARRLALELSRVCIPATYVIISSLVAVFPLLPAIQHLDTRWQTPVTVVWMISRWLTFLLLGATTAWHTRPRLLLYAAFAMLVAFVGVTVAPSQWPGIDVAAHWDLLAMLLFQFLLGIALGMIYYGSLYFGMVLSEGATEHGGYHEALIGAGSVVGPAAGAIAQFIRPGDLVIGISAVGLVTAATLVAALNVAIRFREPNPPG